MVTSGYNQRSAGRRGRDDPDTNQRFITILPKLLDTTHTVRPDETGNIFDLAKNPNTCPAVLVSKHYAVASGRMCLSLAVRFRPIAALWLVELREIA